MADGQKNIIAKFFTNITPEKRAERMLIFHTFILTAAVFWQMTYTQIYLNSGHDKTKLTNALRNSDFTHSSHIKVLEDVYPLRMAATPTNADKEDMGKAIVAYVHHECLPLWKVVDHEQTWFRNLLIVATSIYALYTLVYLYKVSFQRDTSDLSPMEKRIEVTVWTLTQTVEVFVIVFGIIAFFNLYANILTPKNFNSAEVYADGKNGTDVDILKPTKDDAYHLLPNEAHCFAMDRLLGGKVWGKHTPFIWDKMMNDAIIMIVVFVSTFFRWLLLLFAFACLFEVTVTLVFPLPLSFVSCHGLPNTNQRVFQVHPHGAAPVRLPRGQAG